MKLNAFDRIKKANEQLDDYSDHALNPSIRSFEDDLNGVNASTTVWVALDAEDTHGWTVGWMRRGSGKKGWCFVASFDGGDCVDLLSAPRHVRIAALSKLEDVANAIADKTEELVARHCP